MSNKDETGTDATNGSAPPRKTDVEIVLGRAKRGRGGVGELLEHREDILAEAEIADARSRAERERIDALRAELMQLHVNFDAFPEGEERDIIEKAIKRRRKTLAKALGESLEFVEITDEIASRCELGEHFGHLKWVLPLAVDAGFVRIIERKEYEAAKREKKKGLLLEMITYARIYYRVASQQDALSRYVWKKLRDLWSRALDHADVGRAEKESILSAGLAPEARQLLQILNPKHPLAETVRFGCFVKQLRLQGKRGGISYYNGFVELVIAWEDGQKFLSVVRATDGLSGVLPIATAVVKKGMEPETLLRLTQYLIDIANQAIWDDADAAKQNQLDKRGQNGLYNILKSKAEDRRSVYEAFRGAEWRSKEAPYLVGKGLKAARERFRHMEERDFLAAKSWFRTCPLPSSDLLIAALHPRFQVPQPLHFVLFIRNLPFAPKTEEAGELELRGGAAREAKLAFYTGVVRLKVTPVAETDDQGRQKKTIEVAEVLGPIAEVLAPQTWTFPVRVFPAGQAMPPPTKERRMPDAFPMALLAHAQVRGFDSIACGKAALGAYKDFRVKCLRAEEEEKKARAAQEAAKKEAGRVARQAKEQEQGSESTLPPGGEAKPASTNGAAGEAKPSGETNLS